MKICPVCHSQVSDGSFYCTMCGNRLPDDAQSAPALPHPEQETYQSPYQQPVYQQPVYQQPIPSPFDHTAEFDAQDVSRHKLYAMLMYLTGLVGVFFALIGAKDSAYVQFHVRQILKFTIVELLAGMCMGLLFFTLIVPIVVGIFLIVIEVIRIICFFQVAGGKSKEPAIISSLGFLK